MTEQPGNEARSRWQQRYDAALAAGRVRDADFTTLSGLEVEPAYGPADETAVPGSADAVVTEYPASVATGASAAYLTVSEIFPMETRAMAISSPFWGPRPSVRVHGERSGSSRSVHSVHR